MKSPPPINHRTRKTVCAICDNVPHIAHISGFITMSNAVAKGPFLDPRGDIHHIFMEGFRDKQFHFERRGEAVVLEHCLMAGVAAAEVAGWHFSGPDKVVVDSVWFEKLLVLTASPHSVLGDRLQHLLLMKDALGEYREHIRIMGRDYFLPPEIVTLLRLKGSGQ